MKKMAGRAANNDGITLIELLVVVAIVGILAIALGFSYQGWIGKYNIESETKQFYSDLMEARTMAMARSRMHFVVITANNYTIYEDTNDNEVAEPGAGDNPISEYRNPATGAPRPKVLQYNLGWTGTITFNTRGLTAFTNPISIPVNVPPDLAGSTPDYDCVLVYQSRIAAGQMSGGVCVYK